MVRSASFYSEAENCTTLADQDTWLLHSKSALITEQRNNRSHRKGVALQAWACFFGHYWWDRFPVPTFLGEYLYDSANLGALRFEPIRGSLDIALSGKRGAG